MKNPYDVERSWPAYFLEHREITLGEQGTHKCGDLPVWVVRHPAGTVGDVVIIETSDCLVVYDTGLNRDAGKHVAAEIKKISAKPVKVIFYSHHHPDHINGTDMIVDPADVAAGKVDIYAWENFLQEKESESGEFLQRGAAGFGYYSGAFLDPEDMHHHGIGLAPENNIPGYIPPTKLLTEDTKLTIGGLEIIAFYSGGEAISEFCLHIPSFDLVAISDEFMTGIPNTHSIRGSKPRIPDNYIEALKKTLVIEPEWLVGCHFKPIQGKEVIKGHLEKYIDMTKYLWDQSVRLINTGYTPVELQHALQEFPEELWDPPFTVPMYGCSTTATPEYFTGWVSWFNGDSTDLFPSLPAVKAKRFAEVMGGVDKVLDAAKADHKAGRHQLAAELAQIALRADPENEDARLVKAAALRALGYQELNPICRSWYLTGAKELEGDIDPDKVLAYFGKLLKGALPVATIVKRWRYQLDPDKAKGVRLVVGIHAVESGEEITVRVRHRVLHTEDGLAPDAAVVVELTQAQAEGEGTPKLISGDIAAWDKLQSLLDTEWTGWYMQMR